MKRRITYRDWYPVVHDRALDIDDSLWGCSCQGNESPSLGPGGPGAQALCMSLLNATSEQALWAPVLARQASM